MQTGAHRSRIIAVTANVMEGDRQRYIAAGMDAYISKPFQLDELKAMLRKYGAFEHPRSASPR